MKQIGETVAMPGTPGFTAAFFKVDEVPIGTRLFIPTETEINHRNDLMAVLYAVFTHFGTEGVAKVTGDALKTRDQEPPPCPICSGDCAGANPPVMNCPVQRENDLKRALAPLVAIADAYDASGLDEARPEWTKPEGVTPEQIELYAGRGGKRLLTLAHCLKAREVAR
jgi:hypothetical protein